MKKSAPIRILLADDHPVVREGLTTLINREPGMRVIAVAADGREALAQFIHHRPDVVLLDLRMPVIDGIHALTSIRQHDPAASVVLLTGFDDEEDVYSALAAGARGYLLKDSSIKELSACIRAVSQGNMWIPPNVASKLANRISRLTLSPREAEVLRFVAAGKSNKEIAEALRITEGTVKAHVDHILKKLGARGRTEAAAMAFRLGLVRLE